jgi:hypothetical protein
MTTIEIGAVVAEAFVIVEQDGDFPAWFLTCEAGHRFWATTQQIETNRVQCSDCTNADKIRADKLAALNHARNAELWRFQV